MKRSLLAAPVVALLIVGGAGVAFAQDDDPPRDCDTVAAELASVEAAATLPVTIDGVTYPNLGAVNTALAGLPDIEAVAPLREKLQAIVSAAAKVDVLKSEQTTCTDTTAGPEPTDSSDPEPTETADPTTQAPTTSSDPAVLYADCAAAREAGAAPIAFGDPGYRSELDADSDGVACETTEDFDTTGSASTSTASGGSGSADSVPSGGVATGYAG